MSSSETSSDGMPTFATTIEELDDALDQLGDEPVAVVMTMGALHEGHASLIRTAHEHGAVLVTIFVNPLQFGPGEDLDRYPRTLAADIDLCTREGVEVVFAPAPEEVYPEPPRVVVSAGEMGRKLCGRSRPGHFDGVLTVVAKLLHLTAPDVAVFGQKDAQQLALVSRMVEDLDFGVEIVGVPTVREPDGLAMSSRNTYLAPEERQSALALSRALRAAEQHPADPLEAAREVIDTEPGVRLDYLELVDPGTLEPVTGPHPAALLAVAAWVGTTRLIDNVVLEVQARTPEEP